MFVPWCYASFMGSVADMPDVRVWVMGEHLYRMYEAFPGSPDTRFLRCVLCGYSFEGQLEDANEPACIPSE